MVVVGATTVAALVVLRLVGIQIYTEPWTVDPWFYTALMANFDFVYEHFGTTYFASRLPAILPGLFLNSFLTPQQAYLVLHLVFFLAGGVFLYLLVRTLFGVGVAVLLYPAVLLNAIYVDAHTWDYVDGFVITYLSGGLYFLASCVGGRSRVRPALAGFFFAAAVTTNLFATALVLGGIAAYLFVRLRTDRRAALARLAVEGTWLAAGAGVLLVACGLFARQHGGRFLFFMPSIDALRTNNMAEFKVPGYDWMRGEPRLLVPGFLAAVVALTWRRGERSKGERLGLALTVMGVRLVVLLAEREFRGPSTILQLEYYFDQLFPYFFIMLATAVFLLLSWASPEISASLSVLAGIGLVVGAIPLVVVFGIGRTELWGPSGAAITVALMAATVLLAFVLRLGLARWLTPAVAFVAVVLAAGSVGYASAANLSTHWKMANQGPLASAGDVFSIGVDLMDFMKSNGLEKGPPPAFWFDQSRDASLLSLQSLYFPFTVVSSEMSMPTPKLRARLEELSATRVVLLCADPACGRGGEALKNAGYEPVLVAAQRLDSGSKSVWVEAYRLIS
jgi:hypothetical protein